MKLKTILLTSLLLLTTACTTPKVAAMASAATIIKIKDPSEVIDKLADICSRSGLEIDLTGTSNIVCSRVGSVMAQALFRTKYGSDVRIYFKFTAFSAGKGHVRVVTTTSMGSQNAFGQDRTSNLGPGNNTNQEAQNILDTARAELEEK